MHYQGVLCFLLGLAVAGVIYWPVILLLQYALRHRGQAARPRYVAQQSSTPE